MTDTNEHEAERVIAVEDQDPAHWKGDGWAARIIKNEDDDGWAVEMTRDGELEPALVGPWTMGRDKKNPKPLDPHAFAVLVRAANEVRTRAPGRWRSRDRKLPRSGRIPCPPIMPGTWPCGRWCRRFWYCPSGAICRVDSSTRA